MSGFTGLNNNGTFKKQQQQQQQHTFALIVDHTLDRLEALPLVRDVEGLKDVREGRIVPTNPADGSLQVEEALLLQRTWSAPLTPYHTKKCSSQNPYKGCQRGVNTYEINYFHIVEI